MKIGDFFVRLGVLADTFTVRDFTKAIGDIPFSVASAITSLAGLSVGFVEMTKEVLDMTTGLTVFTAETGENTRALQQWQMVAKQAGLTGGEVTSSFSSLSNIIGQMNIGNVNDNVMKAAAMIGMNGIPTSAGEFLNQIQAGVSGKDPKTASAILQAFGIPAAMMRTFQTSQSERESLSPEMNEKQIQQMAEFQKSLAQFNTTIMDSFISVLAKIEPELKDIADLLALVIKSGGGALATASGETATFLNAVHKQGGFSTFMENLANSQLSPAQLREGGAYTHNITVNQDIDVNGVTNPEDAGPIIGNHAKRPLIKAITDQTRAPRRG